MKIRKYLRQSLVQTALLKLPDSEEIPCEIRNFCQAGLFLKLIRPGSIKEAPSQTDEAEVVFISYRAESIFRLAGRLSHVSSTGAGIVFDRPPPFQVLLALQEVALADPLERHMPAKNAEIQKRCVMALDTMLRALSNPLSIQIDAQLDKDRDGESGRSKAPDPSDPPVPEADGKRVVERFCSYALEQAKNFVVPDLSLQPEAGAIYTESQAQRLAFKDWMNLMDKIIQLESKFDATLKTLEARFNVLAHREIANHNNPFGPSVLLYTFHYTMKEVHLNNDQREKVYAALTRLLDEGLDKLYQELRAVSKPLEASITNLSLEITDHPAVTPSREEPPISLAPAKPEEIWHAPAPPQTTLPPTSFPPDPRALPVLRGKPPQETRPTHPSKPTLGAKTHPKPATLPSPAPQKMAAIPHRPDAFTAFVVLTRYAEAQANKGLPEVAADIDRFEIVDALSRQLQAASREQPFPYFSAPKLQADLGQFLATVGEEKAVYTNLVKENLQIIGLMLDAMLADLSTPACITPYIMKLQIPLLIASFADPGLLYAQTHPGREIINQLDCLTQAANTQGEFTNPHLLQTLESLFNRIIKEVANNPQVFTEVLESMEKLTAPLLKAYSARLDRLVESCEGGQKLEHARQLVDREIDVRIGGKTVPSVVLSLLDAGWRQLLVLTVLRQGTDNDEWRRQFASIDLLMAWLAKQDPSPPPNPSTIRGFKTYLREGLSGINAEPVEVKHVLEKIEKLLPEDGSKPSPPAYVDIPAADTTQIERENALKFRVAAFRVGDWLKFLSNQNAWVPLRLSWIGQDPGRFVFTNRKGIKSLEVDSAKLAQILDEKRASRIESLDDLSLVERTAKSLLSTLRDRLR